MIKKIYKYPLEVTDIQTIMIPIGAEILCVQVQNDVPCIWAKVDPQMSLTQRGFVMYGTGQPITQTNNIQKYIGTFQIIGGRPVFPQHLVFHLFELL